MKTTAFLIRVAICFLLSLIPVSELENRIYSLRMEHRGPYRGTSDILIVELDLFPPESTFSKKAFQSLREKLIQKGATATLMALSSHWNQLGNDSDGIVRRASLTFSGRPSLAKIAHRELKLDSTFITHKLKDPHLINYLGPAGTIPHCHLKDLQKALQPESNTRCGTIRGKIILFSENTEDYPNLHTPLGEMSPSEVLANDIETVIHHRPIHSLAVPIRLALILTIILLGALCIVYYPVMVSAIAITGTGILIVTIFFQFLFQFFDLYIPSANVYCSLLITYLIFTGYRLAMQENLQWRSLKEAQYIRELDQMKTNFLSLVSHDLKTPLAKIQAMVERLRRELPSERSDWKELIDSIENSNIELQRFITSILNLSKLESQKVILNKKSNDINLLIQQALKRLRPLAQQKNIKMEEYLEPLFSIECDEDLMRQVLTNLIDNAIKYSTPHSKVIVRSSEEDGFVRVDVEDFGPGIPKDQLPFMFRKFSRFIRPTKEQIKGTGLGLYLSKYFIELHGGSIRLKSVEGKGTTFTFTLPLHGVEGETILG